jgi:dihydroflavonol-4-reductase
MDLRSPFWKGRRVCVTGGTGFLGSHIVKQLLEQQARVRILALPPASAHPLLALGEVDRVFGDLRDRELVQRTLAGSEVIFHTAGVVAVWGPALAQMHAIHVQGTANVLAAAPAGARVVHTSSIVAVGASRIGVALVEDSPFDLTTLQVDYVHAKRAAEELALQAQGRGRWVVVTNPGYLLGPEDHERSVMGRFCLRFWKGRLLMAPPGGFNFVDVRDAARGHLLAAEHGRSGCRYILGGANHTLKDFMILLAQAGALRPRAIPRAATWAMRALATVAEGRAWLSGREPYPAVQHARLNRFYWYGSSERAVRELGYTSRPLPDTLADTYRWYAERRLLSLRGINRWWMRPRSGPAQAA